MNNYINIYNGEVVSGNTSGTVVSSNDNTNPIYCALNAREADSECILLAIRSEKGYAAYDVTISFDGQTASKWMVAKDDGYTKDNVLSSASWSSSIFIDEIHNANILFWVKAISTADELPLDDKTVKAKVSATIAEDSSST